MTKKISPALHAELLKLAEQGQDSEQLAEWLGKTHDVWVTSRQVRRIIRAHRTELADVAKSVVREELRKHLLPTVRRVSRAAVRAELMAKAARKRAKELRKIHEQHPSAVAEDILALKAMDRSIKASNVIMHYAGLNQPDRPGAISGKVTDAREALLQRIKVLAGVADPKTEPQVH